MHALAAQRDPQVWGPDADTFDPGRWDAKALRRWPDRFFTPFGTGPRTCIGRAFAMQESALLVSRIATAHRLRLPAVTDEVPTEPVMRERGTLRPQPFTLGISTA